MLLAPLLLTIAALGAIRRIILEPLAVIGRSPLTLAFWPAAHHLIRTITGRSEELLTIRTNRKSHIHPLQALFCALLKGLVIVETDNLLENVKTAELLYGGEAPKLSFSCRYTNRLFSNVSISKFLATRYPDVVGKTAITVFIVPCGISKQRGSSNGTLAGPATGPRTTPGPRVRFGDP